MKAARIYGTRDLRVEKIPIKELQPHQVKIKVEYAGICGSDLHIYTNFESGIIPTEPHPMTGGKAPLVIGHEFSGIIEEVGADVNDYKIGDRVCIEPTYYCGTCRECRKGHYHICRTSNSALVGNATDGGFAEYCVTEADKLHLLPDNVSLEEGALVEPTAVAYHGVIRSGLQAGQKVLINGAGPIGLLTAEIVKAAGATMIIVSDVSEERLALAKSMGATHTLNPMKVDVIAEIMKLTHNDGVDISFEAAGVQATIDSAIAATKRKGTVLVLALFMQPPKVNLFDAILREITIKLSVMYANEFPQVIDLMATKQIDVSKVVTSKIKLDDIVSEGFEKLLNDKTEAKILIEMD